MRDDFTNGSGAYDPTAAMAMRKPERAAISKGKGTDKKHNKTELEQFQEKVQRTNDPDYIYKKIAQAKELMCHYDPNTEQYRKINAKRKILGQRLFELNRERSKSKTRGTDKYTERLQTEKEFWKKKYFGVVTTEQLSADFDELECPAPNSDIPLTTL